MANEVPRVSRILGGYQRSSGFPEVFRIWMVCGDSGGFYSYRSELLWLTKISGNIDGVEASGLKIFKVFTIHVYMIHCRS